jgi:hypothetical protein
MTQSDAVAKPMGVRRRAVRERLERKAARAVGLAAFHASLARLKSVIDSAIAEGLKTMTAEELSRRLTAFDRGGVK